MACPLKIIHWIAKLYFPLAVLCVFLTNSRTTLLLLFLFLLIQFFRSKKKVLILFIIAISGVIIFQYLPENTKHRYMAILYDSGLVERTQPMSRVDQWTEASSEGRIIGLEKGLEIFKQYPFSGVGPGGFQYVTGTNLQTHNLIGQVASETGVLGIISFLSVVFAIFSNCSRVKRIIAQTKNITVDLSFAKDLNTAIVDAITLLLFGSMFAHTLFFSWWLFLAAFSFLNKVLLINSSISDLNTSSA